MEPVEIDAGAYYLRQFRADDRLDDRLALVAAFADDSMRRFVTRWQVGDRVPLPLRRVDYLPAPDNEASARVAAKCGFVRQAVRDGHVSHRREFTDRQH